VAERSRLLSYGPEMNEWTERYDVPGFLWMTPLPRRERMLLQEFALASESWQTRIWQQGEISTAYVAGDGESAISMGQTDPGGDQLLAYAYRPDEAETRALVIDLDDCDETCATAATTGIPHWSPDGSRAIYSGDAHAYPNPLLIANGRVILLESTALFPEQPLALGAGDAARPEPLLPLGQGYSPFWLDNQTFGFIRRVNGPDAYPPDEVEIVLASVDDPTPQTILRGFDLVQFLPDERVRQLTLAYGVAHPAWPGKLFIVARDDRAEEAFVFDYDLATGLPALRLTLRAEFNHSLGFSPDGRYLVLTGTGYQPSDPDSNLAPLLLHDIAANRTVPLLARLPYFLPSGVYDWTRDGLLAVALDENLIGLIDPDRGGVRLLGHNRGACTSVAWLE
jgi:hypothetical protein